MFDFLSKLLVWFVKEFGLPPIGDGEALQKWLLRYLKMAGSLAKWIPGERDDRFVALAVEVVGDKEAWKAIHGWILIEFGGLPFDSDKYKRMSQEAMAADVAKGLGVDVQDVLDFLKWLIGIIEMLFGK